VQTQGARSTMNCLKELGKDLFQASLWLLDVPWLVAVEHQYLHGVLPVCMSSCVHVFLFRRHKSSSFRTSSWPHFTLITSGKTLSLNKVTF
jgi:hypothetical protein